MQTSKQYVNPPNIQPRISINLYPSQANVLVSINHQAMIADFGISHFSVTATLISNGTANWMAPELLKGVNARATQKSDIWSFGCLCYEVRYLSDRVMPPVLQAARFSRARFHSISTTLLLS